MSGRKLVNVNVNENVNVAGHVMIEFDQCGIFLFCCQELASFPSFVLQGKIGTVPEVAKGILLL